MAPHELVEPVRARSIDLCPAKAVEAKTDNPTQIESINFSGI